MLLFCWASTGPNLGKGQCICSTAGLLQKLTRASVHTPEAEMYYRPLGLLVYRGSSSWLKHSLHQLSPQSRLTLLVLSSLVSPNACTSQIYG